MMNIVKPNYQLQIPIDAVLFDCDGTLSCLEGIDELARMNGVGEQVEKLTAQAMGKTGINPDLYQRRLELVQPTLAQMHQLGQLYFTERTPDIVEVIQVLQALGKEIYILSAGFYLAISLFASLLNIRQENIFAVDTYFDAAGKFIDFDHNSPLTMPDGKKLIANQLKQQHTHLLHVGDGLNDYATYEVVSRFIGYGGAFFHQKLAARCEYYINSPSMAALLPLCLTETELHQLTDVQLQLYKKGLKLINE